MIITNNYLRAIKVGQTPKGKNFGSFFIGGNTFVTLYTEENKPFTLNKMYKFEFSVMSGNSKEGKTYLNCYKKASQPIDAREMTNIEKEKYKQNKEKQNKETQNKDSGEYDDTLPF